MKKAALVLLFLGLSAAPGFGQTGNVAVGPILSGNILFLSGPLNGLGITGKIPGIDPIFGLNFAFGQSSSFVGATADWWLYKQSVYEPFNLNFYAGPGFFTDIVVSQVSAFDLGLRVPFGVNWVPLKFLEAFLELAPAFGISFTDPIAPTWRIQGAIGARFWF